MEKAFFSMKFFIFLLFASSMVFSMVPGAQGQRCTTVADCKGIRCIDKTLECRDGRCQCVPTFGTKISCSKDFDCNKEV
ncbi:Uncharacterized protein TCM_011411 [Theobroma cacao]|uniref:Uncharacterized protein n=1 Tax=Theobroma cacao TaxID=3641 RepID=A0A061EA84_THECC|nr:Uncharacterized protein TCM_011411 [Theobroma cacao]